MTQMFIITTSSELDSGLFQGLFFASPFLLVFSFLIAFLGLALLLASISDLLAKRRKKSTHLASYNGFTLCMGLFISLVFGWLTVNFVQITAVFFETSSFADQMVVVLLSIPWSVLIMFLLIKGKGIVSFRHTRPNGSG
jgi:hypothetical protein